MDKLREFLAHSIAEMEALPEVDEFGSYEHGYLVALKDIAFEFFPGDTALHGGPSLERVEEIGLEAWARARSTECPHCHWGFDPSVIEQHIREKH